VEGRLARIDHRIGAAMAVVGAAGLPLLHVRDSEFQALWHGVPAACLVCGVLVVEANGRLPKSRTLKLLGDCSYSIYLVNAAFLSAFNLAILRLRPPVEDMSVGAPLTLLGLFGAAVAGHVVYRLVERPAIDRLNLWAFGKGASPAADARWAPGRAVERIGA
jgi:exopolysaccharide production protein ExoZ